MVRDGGCGLSVTCVGVVVGSVGVGGKRGFEVRAVGGVVNSIIRKQPKHKSRAANVKLYIKSCSINNNNKNNNCLFLVQPRDACKSMINSIQCNVHKSSPSG